jgi:hypothetical protein
MFAVIEENLVLAYGDSSATNEISEEHRKNFPLTILI